jgi:hypothetical protein
VDIVDALVDTTRGTSERLLVDRIHGTDDKGTTRPRSVEEGDILPVPPQHVRAADELAALLGDAELERTRDERDDVPLRRIELGPPSVSMRRIPRQRLAARGWLSDQHF